MRDGKAITSALVRSDDEIVAWVRHHAGQDVVPAIDAPLVIPNVTGRRRCESLLSACFHSAQAGAHSANLSLPAFAGGIRAARLASELDLISTLCWTRARRPVAASKSIRIRHWSPSAASTPRSSTRQSAEEAWSLVMVPFTG